MPARSRRSEELPLRYRLPNPPATFVGREEDLAWLESTLQRGPLAIVAGPSGIGRRALVLHALTRRLRAKASRAIYVDLGVASTGALQALVGAFVEVGYVEAIRWPELLASPASLPATVLDIAESRRACVVLLGASFDDSASGREARDLAAMLSAYARKSRWVVTTDEAPKLEAVAGRTRALDAMSPGELEALARALAPKRLPVAEARAIAARAAGLPAAVLRELGLATSTSATTSVNEASKDVIEVLGALVVASRFDAARALLEREGEALVEAGRAHRLHALLWPTKAEALATWRIRAAVELGDPNVLAELDATAADAPDALLAWSRVLLARGDMRATRAAADRAHDLAVQREDAKLASEATLMIARCMMFEGRMREALERMTEGDPVEVAGRARRDRLMGKCLVALGDIDAGLAHVRRARQALPALSPRSREEVAYGVAEVLYGVGRLREAEEVLGLLEGGRSLFAHHAAYAIFLRACIATDQGRLEDSKALLLRLEPFLFKGGLLGGYHRTLSALRRLAAGELAGLGDELDLAMDQSLRANLLDLGCSAATFRAELALALAERAPVLDAALSTSGAQEAEVLALTHQRLRLRANEPVDAIEPDARRAEATIVRHLVLAERALLLGDAAASRLACVAAITVASDLGYGYREADARALLCGALLALDRRDELRVATEGLAALASRMGSKRFALEARFFEAIANDLAPGTLQSLSTSLEVAPVAARRALALLGGSARLDALDRAVLGARLERAGGPAKRLDLAHEPARARPGWGFHVATREIWLEEGQVIDLGSRPKLFKILEVLWDAGGTASKETLANKVWAIEPYHPLRDDNRLQAAVRKLRAIIEDDASRPVRVVTTEDGYALASSPARFG